MEAVHVVVMIVGVLTLIGIRLIVAFVGRDYREDHPRRPQSATEPHGPAKELSQASPRVVRGTGRDGHLLYVASDNGSGG
jgi:hypothetical protein